MALGTKNVKWDHLEEIAASRRTRTSKRVKTLIFEISTQTTYWMTLELRNATVSSPRNWQKLSTKEWKRWKRFKKKRRSNEWKRSKSRPWSKLRGSRLALKTKSEATRTLHHAKETSPTTPIKKSPQKTHTMAAAKVTSQTLPKYTPLKSTLAVAHPTISTASSTKSTTSW